MRKLYYICLSISFILLSNLDAFSQDGADPQEVISRTWYAHNIGKPDGKNMNPTKRKETWTFNQDGTMNLKEGRMNMEFDGSWEYLEASNSIKASLNIQGKMETFEFPILRLTKDTLLLVNPGEYAMEYTTTPPDPNRKIREAPLVVDSESTIEVDEWTGLHPFNHKITTYADGSIEKTESVGVIVLIQVEGNKVLRINDDGLTTDVKVSGTSEIAGQKHFGLVTDDPELAGEVVFNEDGSFYVYRDKDQSTVEYIKE